MNTNPRRGSGGSMGPFLVALVLAALVPAGATADEASKCSSPLYRDLYACREVIVTALPGFDVEATRSRFQLVLLGQVEQLHQIWFLAPVGTDLDNLMSSLRGVSGVRSVSYNSEFAASECRQLNIPALELSSQTPASIAAQPALGPLHRPSWGSNGAGVVVAVLDTGISRRHPAVASALMPFGIDPVGGTALADDLGNGIDEDHDGIPDAGWGHGTAVASLVHAVAPAARLLPVRVIGDECNGTAFALTAGIVAAVDAGAHVLCLGIGANEEHEGVEAALAYANDHGVLVVAAGGNFPPGSPEPEVQFPAESAGTLAVAAVDSKLVAAPFTARGEEIGLSAPGVDVLVAWRNTYARASGTSISAAIVSGAAAVALGTSPFLDRAALQQVLRQRVTPVDPYNSNGLRGQLGSGIPDLSLLSCQLCPLATRPVATRPVATRPAEASRPAGTGEPTRRIPGNDDE